MHYQSGLSRNQPQQWSNVIGQYQMRNIPDDSLEYIYISVSLLKKKTFIE